MPAQTTDIFELQFLKNHLFALIEGERWLIDTGSPSSFGRIENIRIAEEEILIPQSYLGLTPESLSELVKVSCAGLLGIDVLNRFDQIYHIEKNELIFSTDELSHPGQELSLGEFMGVPLVTVSMGGTDYRMFFDTGAQISYFEEGLLNGFPSLGVLTDFYPMIGEFEVETHEVPILLGDIECRLRCGTLPGVLSMLLMGEISGILGNEIMTDRAVAFFPRRKQLVL